MTEIITNVVQGLQEVRKDFVHDGIIGQHVVLGQLTFYITTQEMAEWMEDIIAFADPAAEQKITISEPETCEEGYRLRLTSHNFDGEAFTAAARFSLEHHLDFMGTVHTALHTLLRHEALNDAQIQAFGLEQWLEPTPREKILMLAEKLGGFVLRHIENIGRLHENVPGNPKY